jgi:dipeptidase E
MQTQIIASGGGGFGRSVENLQQERYILEQCGAERPKVGFLPQASCEDGGYTASFYEAFTRLGAEPTRVSLFGVVKPEWEERLLSQDVIYVGGGNTRSMLALWREWGVDQVLRQAWQNGTVLAGVSAGAICWFEQGVTDSVWPLGVLPCLGFLQGSCCPHFDGEVDRRPSFTRMLAEGSISPGIALDDCAMGHYIDGELHRVVCSSDTSNGYLMSAGEEEVVAEVIRI